MITTFITAWIVTSVICYGSTFAYLQRQFPTIAKEMYKEDMFHSIIVSLIPFVGFIIGTFLNGFYKHGFKFR